MDSQFLRSARRPYFKRILDPKCTPNTLQMPSKSRRSGLQALPKCPPGYRYSVEQKQCVPKTEKDDVRNNKGGSKESKPSNSPGYNVWGRTGVTGDGYAYAEPNNWDTDAYDGPSIGNYN